MLEGLIEALTPWFRDWGLIIVVVATFLESSIVVASVLPGESILLLAGFFCAPSAVAASGRPVLSLTQVILVGFAGALAGDVVGYVIGRVGGRSITRRFGRFMLLPERRLPILERYFAHYGGRAILFGRFAPFLRSVRTLVAGIAEMPLKRFLPPAAIGAAAWSAGIATAGFLLGESWRVANRYLGAGGVVVFALLALAFVLTWRSVRVRLERELATQTPAPVAPDPDGTGRTEARPDAL